MSLAVQTTASESLRKLAIDERVFWNEVRREADYHDETPQPLYLDLKTGRIFRALGGEIEAVPEAMGWVEKCPLRNTHAQRRQARYSIIPRLEHSDYGQLLKSFLASDWTRDDVAKQRARLAYSTSVARWMKQVDDPKTIRAFLRFRDLRLKEQVTDLLHCAGIEPEWNTH